MREKRWKRFLNAMTCFPTATTHRIHTVFRLVSGKRVRYQDGLRKHDSTSSHLSFQPARYQAKHVLKDCPFGASFRTHQGRREGALIEFQFEGENFFLLDSGLRGALRTNRRCTPSLLKPPFFTEPCTNPVSMMALLSL